MIKKDLRTLVNERDSRGHGAAPRGATRRPSCVKILLDAGANVDERDRHGMTALMWAASLTEDKDTVKTVTHH